MKGWRREDPDYNPNSVGCTRDLVWLLEDGKWHTRLWWGGEWHSREIDNGHQILSVRDAVAVERVGSDVPFSLHFAPFCPDGELPKGTYSKPPHGLPSELEDAWRAHYAPALRAHDPRTRFGAMVVMTNSFWSGSCQWEDYKTKDLRGVSKLLDGHYKAMRRAVREAERAKNIKIAEKIL